MLERRAAPRVAARLDAAYEDAERQVFLRTRDVSEGGVFLISADPPGEGATARVLLELPGHAALIRLHGTVSRRELEREPTGFVLRFDPAALPHAAREALRSFVARALAAPG